MRGILTRVEGKLYEALRRAHSDVTLVSPFITSQVAYTLAGIAATSKATWRVLTRLDAGAVAGGFLSVPGLERLLEADVELIHSERLHGKVYLVDGDFGLVGSANLTAAALGSSATVNLEMSVLLNDPELSAARRLIGEWLSLGTPVDLDRLRALDDLARSIPIARVPIADNSLTTSGDAGVVDLLSDVGEDIQLWVKAQFGAPDRDQWRGPHWFSSSKRGKPSFKPGDLALIYAKDTHECYVIVEVTGHPRHDPGFVISQGYSEGDAARWPWVSETIPRLVPDGGQVVTLAGLGFSGQSLQVGHKRLSISEFSEAARALSR